MRLLRCKLSEVSDQDTKVTLSPEEIFTNIPPYAILSHRWGKPEEELSFPDIANGLTLENGKGYEKVIGCCEQAIKDGYKYVWIDTCCIDKSSSAELSEAINSMYAWYTRSSICYAYLVDVSKEETPEDYAKDGSDFRKSEWFKRGWTLQELIAPKSVRFYTQDWTLIGNKSDMASLIKEITRIDVEVLRSEVCPPISVAKRMSWAADRVTTRDEDIAYSLMGLFGVNIPTLYGEGTKAFIRLQEEIMRTTYDHSLFAWQLRGPSRGLFAASPDQFYGCSDVATMDYNRYALQFVNTDPKPEYTLTNFGIRIQLPLLQLDDGNVYKAYLACTTPDPSASNSRKLMSIALKGYPGAAVDTYERIHHSETTLEETRRTQFSKIPVKDIYVWSPSLLLESRLPASPELDIHFTIEDSQAFLSPPSEFRSRLLLQYHYGASIKRADGLSFTVRFQRDEQDQYVVFCLGEVQMDMTLEENYIKFFTVVGFYKGQVWTDVTAKAMSSETSIYESYRDPMTSPGNARLKYRPSTKVDFRFQEQHSSVSLSTSVSQGSVTEGRESYRALVNCKWNRI
jgi:hypothetical protein